MKDPTAIPAIFPPDSFDGSGETLVAELEVLEAVLEAVLEPDREAAVLIVVLDFMVAVGVAVGVAVSTACQAHLLPSMSV